VWASIPAFFGGILLWSFAEYCLHRFIFHFTPRTQRQKRIAFLMHGVHHAQPRVKTRLVMPPLGDNTFALGKIGFWTKSDAVSYFADATMTYTPIVPAAQALVNTIMAQQPRILGLQIYTLGTNGTAQILASKEPVEVGQPGTDSELAAIREGTISFGRENGVVQVAMPLHDRNGEIIAAVRFKLKSFFGETQDNAVNRATILLKIMQNLCTSAEDLNKN